MSGLKTTLIITLSAFFLALIWNQFSHNPTPDQQSSLSLAASAKELKYQNDLLARIESLEANLSSEQWMHQQLESRLSRLEQQPMADTALNPETATAAPPAESEPGEAREKPHRTDSLQDRLLAVGIPLDSIQRIKQHIDQNRLALLNLRDQAIREDWLDSTKYNEMANELRDPGQGLRKQLGDSVYDQYLYASGRPNRVIVNEVYSGSAADTAGVQPQDIILRYASIPIFAMTDLQQATVEGNAGEAVLLEILRDELPYSTSVPRGPLGISMTIIRKPPE